MPDGTTVEPGDHIGALAGLLAREPRPVVSVDAVRRHEVLQHGDVLGPAVGYVHAPDGRTPDTPTAPEYPGRRDNRGRTKGSRSAPAGVQRLALRVAGRALDADDRV